MASYKEHCKDCREALGEDFSVVHMWLDELCKYYNGNYMHRSYRHHDAGVNEVIKKWGEKAGLAAEIHIRRDFSGLDRIPTLKDWEEPEKMLKCCDFYINEIKEMKNEK